MNLTFDHVNCIYDADTNTPVHALEDICLEIGAGEFVGLIGHTGSGKSTLIQHMNGLLRPTSGRILADGEDIWGDRYDRRALRSRVGLVFQYPEHQLFESDLLADVAFGPLNLGRSKEEAREMAIQALTQVGIDKEIFLNSPFDLSGGQKRRAAIAGVLAMEPELLILDEPTAGLDPRGREEILALVADLRSARGISVLLVSHSMEDVARHADRLLVMDHGRLRFDEAPQAVFQREEALEGAGLQAPETMQLLRMLRERGLGSGEDICPVTAEETAEVILQWLR